MRQIKNAKPVPDEFKKFPLWLKIEIIIIIVIVAVGVLTGDLL